MARDTARHDELVEGATGYVLEHGIAGLSLRPLAAALGTSDRMLVYHFGSKDALVAEVIERSNERSVAALRALRAAGSPGGAVGSLWRAWQQPPIARCLRVYVQTAALGLLGDEPYLSAARRANQLWREAVSDFLIRSGVSPERSTRVAELVDATLFGLFVDQPVDEADSDVGAVVDDLSEAVSALAR